MFPTCLQSPNTDYAEGVVKTKLIKIITWNEPSNYWIVDTVDAVLPPGKQVADDLLPSTGGIEQAHTHTVTLNFHNLLPSVPLVLKFHYCRQIISSLS